MAALTKVGQFIFEQELGTADGATTNDVVGVIDRNSLGMPGSSIPEPSGAGSIVYLVRVTALFVTGDWSYDMTKTLDVMFHYSGTDSSPSTQLYVTPIIGSQVAATNTLARLHDAWDIYVAGRTTDAGAIPGSVTLTDDAINIVVNKSTAQTLGGSKVVCKVFADIYAHGDDAT